MACPTGAMLVDISHHSNSPHTPNPWSSPKVPGAFSCPLCYTEDVQMLLMVLTCPPYEHKNRITLTRIGPVMRFLLPAAILLPPPRPVRESDASTTPLHCHPCVLPTPLHTSYTRVARYGSG